MKNAILSFSVLLTLSAYAQTEVKTTAGTESQTTETAKVALSSSGIRPQHFLPALGQFTPTGSSAEQLTITVDEQNLGIIWVEGFAEGRFKALLKQRPSLYKIPAQKTESGKSIPEGSLWFNPETSELTIVLGKAFNDGNPSAVFAAESKGGRRYTGKKVTNE